MFCNHVTNLCQTREGVAHVVIYSGHQSQLSIYSIFNCRYLLAKDPLLVICDRTFNIFIKCLGCNFTLHYFHQSQASDRKIKNTDWGKSIQSQEKVRFVSSTFNSYNQPKISTLGEKIRIRQVNVRKCYEVITKPGEQLTLLDLSDLG